MESEMKKKRGAQLSAALRRAVGLLCGFVAVWLVAPAQVFHWYDPLEAGRADSAHYVEGQAWDEDGGNYRRLPRRAADSVRAAVWQLSGESAGLSVRFVTDAAHIRVRYVVGGAFAMPHMPATGVSGVDLYRYEGVGRYTRCVGSYAFADTVRYAYTVDFPDTASLSPFVLYLPLYNEVRSLQVGVPEGARFRFVEASAEAPVVVYGTSIAQGACASRPGMAWTNCVARELGLPVVNLGFSGNGQLERSVVDLMGEVPARAYVLDCMSNMNDRPAAEIARLAEEAVRRLRAVNDAPVLLVEQAGYSDAATNAARRESCARHNEGLRRAYQVLQAEGTGGLFYLSEEELAFPPDAWVDYVHPSDWGMALQAKAVAAKLRQMLPPRP